MGTSFKSSEERTLTTGQTITVHVVGNADNPFLMDELRAAYAADLEDERMAARKRLRAQHGSIDAAVEALVEDMGPEAVAALEKTGTKVNVEYAVLRAMRITQRHGRYVADCVEHGVGFDGKRGKDALGALFIAGGPSALEQAARHVREFNSLKPKTGEG